MYLHRCRVCVCSTAVTAPFIHCEATTFTSSNVCLFGCLFLQTTFFLSLLKEAPLCVFIRFTSANTHLRRQPQSSTAACNDVEREAMDDATPSASCLHVQTKGREECFGDGMLEYQYIATFVQIRDAMFLAISCFPLLLSFLFLFLFPLPLPPPLPYFFFLFLLYFAHAVTPSHLRCYLFPAPALHAQVLAQPVDWRCSGVMHCNRHHRAVNHLSTKEELILPLLQPMFGMYGSSFIEVGACRRNISMMIDRCDDSDDIYIYMHFRNSVFSL